MLEYRGARKEFTGGELATTNNRMELQAAIEALRRLQEPCEVDLFTDSEYVREGITTWIDGWKKRRWKKKIKNKDLWLELDALCNKHTIRWQWVRGHSGVEGNERCDVLSVEAAERVQATHTQEEREAALAEFLRSRAAAPADPDSPQDDMLL